MHGVHGKHYDKDPTANSHSKSESKRAIFIYEQCDTAKICRSVLSTTLQRRTDNAEVNLYAFWTSEIRLYGPALYLGDGLPDEEKQVWYRRQPYVPEHRNIRLENCGYRRNTCEQEATDDSPYVLCGVLVNGNTNWRIPSYKTIQQSHITLKSLFDHILSAGASHLMCNTSLDAMSSSC